MTHAARGAMRQMKNIAKGYTDIEQKVREATSNDPWGPNSTLMAEIADATYSPHEFLLIMKMIDKRMNDHGKNWRHVFKALTLLDYIIHMGSEQVVNYTKENLYIIKTLKEFQFIDEEGKDQGQNVRQKAKDMTALLSDEARLRDERSQRSTMRDRMTGRAYDEGGYIPSSSGTIKDRYPERMERAMTAQEERDLQRAIEESKRLAQEQEVKRNSFEEP
ncbi:hypothetical protein BKA69DRAFT_906860 [Paraphysoderma sedebokerense]|nr:hypothetical protein BKA69DRAFT_906860 [Paraphysoderma sedebokerense]